MGHLSEEVVVSCEQFGTHYKLLNADKAILVRREIESRFAIERSGPLWDRLHSHSGIYDQNGWKLIENFTDSQPILIFFEPHLDKSIVCLKNSLMLSNILGNCSGFIFYATNLTYDYLFCFNDHDALFGAGAAKEWIEGLDRSKEYNTQRS